MKHLRRTEPSGNRWSIESSFAARLGLLPRLALAGACVLALNAGTARAATNAWGSINNFDCVNDNGVECHGFEIEIEDCHSRDTPYTYNWNHYGALYEPFHW